MLLNSFMLIEHRGERRIRWLRFTEEDEEKHLISAHTLQIQMCYFHAHERFKMAHPILKLSLRVFLGVFYVVSFNTFKRFIQL